MKYFTLLILIFVLNINVFSQTTSDDLQNFEPRLNAIERENTRLNSQLRDASSKIEELETLIKSSSDSLAILKQELAETKNSIILIEEKFNKQIKQTEESTTSEILLLDQKVSSNTLYWIVAVLGIGIISFLLFVILRKQLTKSKIDLTDNIKKTSDAIREEQIKLDEQLVKLLDSQMKLLQEQRVASARNNDEVDHSLALKVADEIVRIDKNLSNMNPETRGLKQLAASVKRIQDNFEANGYELVDMLGKQYHPGDRISPTFTPCENGEGTSGVIIGIIKPQVNYKGEMIQQAQVKVCE